MAISSLAPSSSFNPLSKTEIAAKRRADLQLVTDSATSVRADRKSFVYFLSAVAVVGLLLLLAINTMLAQDAFELARLQTQATTLNDHRDAVMKKIAVESSPGVLAHRAKALGMVPSQSPRFLTVDSAQKITKTEKFVTAQ